MTTIMKAGRGVKCTERLAVRPDQARRGRAARRELDDDRLAGAWFARNTDGRAEFEFRFEKRDGDLGVGSKPVHLKLAVVRDAVVKVIPMLAQRKSRIVKVQSTDYPGTCERFAVGSDDMAFDRTARLDRQVDIVV